MAQQQGHCDNPYVGLASYGVHQSSQFHGRQDLIDVALHALSNKQPCCAAFLLLLGQSGSGKRSLAEAGILPALMQHYSGALHPIVLQACDLGDDPFKALLFRLSQSDLKPLYADMHLPDLLALCKREPERFLDVMAQQLNNLNDDDKVVLVVPNLEYLYLNARLNPLQKRLFIELLSHLVDELGVIIIATLRSDLYHLLSETPGLLHLKQRGVQLDISPPDYEQLKRIIEQPVDTLGLQFEVQQTQALADVIAHRAHEYPNSLPLLSFLLLKLVDLRNSEGKLRFSAYRQLGGLDSVLPNYAEMVYENLERSVKRHFTRVFTRLVSRSHYHRYEMQWVSMEELARSERAYQFIDAFVAAGLLQTQYNADGIQMVSLAHDCMLQHWPRLVQTLDAHQEQIALQQQLLQQAKQWQTATRPSAYLLSERQNLHNAKRLLKHEDKVEPAVKALIQASVKRVQRNRILAYFATAVLSVVFMFILTQSYQAKYAAQQVQLSLDQSHELIEFLIADEHEKLNEIGRLDVMADGSEKSVEYLSKVSSEDESSASKLSRSQTFQQIGEVYLQTENYEAALDVFEKALTLNQELLQIHPNAFVYASELAKAYYWLAETYRLAGDADKAEHGYLSFQKLAYDLVKMKPDDLQAKLQLSLAYQKMAEMAVLAEQNERAMQNYLESVKFAEKGRIVADQQQLQNLVDSYAWLSAQYQSEFKITEAMEMAKSRVLASQTKYNQLGDTENQLSWLMAQWDYAEKLILLGKNKLAVSVLEDIHSVSTELFEDDAKNDRALYLQALSLSRQAQIYMLTDKADKAAELMLESEELLTLSEGQADQQWLDYLFERQYWLARLAYEQQQQALLEQLSAHLAAVEHPESQKWKVRLANLTQTQVSLPDLDAQRKTRKPHELIAFLEYATIHRDTKSLPYLRDLVPAEMWLYPDLDQIRSQIRQLL